MPASRPSSLRSRQEAAAGGCPGAGRLRHSPPAPRPRTDRLGAAARAVLPLRRGRLPVAAARRLRVPDLRRDPVEGVEDSDGIEPGLARLPALEVSNLDLGERD